jgi:uncharacterized membrane protein YdbT with pleckstrin-like domain
MEIENGKYYSLGRKTFWLFIAQRSTLSFILLVVAILIRLIVPIFALPVAKLDLVLNWVMWAIILLAVILEIIGVAIVLLQYGVSKIMLDDSSLRMVRGILSKEELTLPYRRIQSVKIKQDIFQRLFGVGHLVISTTTDLDQPSQAGTENEDDDQVIPLLDYSLAETLAGLLSDRAETEKMQVQQKATVI